MTREMFSELLQRNKELEEQYITDLQKEIDKLGKLFYERNEENIRLNNIIEKLEQENAVLKTQVVNKDKYSYGIRMGSDKE